MRSRTTLNMMIATIAGLVLVPPALAASGEGSALSRPSGQSQPAPTRRLVTLEWVGDMALSTELGLPPGGIARCARADQAAIGERRRHRRQPRGHAVDRRRVEVRRREHGTCFAFQAPPSYAQQYRSLGFDVVNQANNHVDGLRRLRSARDGRRAEPCRRRLHRAPRARSPILTRPRHCASRSSASRPTRWTPNLLDIAGAKALVRRARGARVARRRVHPRGRRGRRRDAHARAAREYYLGEDRGDARAFAHAVIDAGRLDRARLRAARDPRRRALPRPADRVLARQLHRLPHARHGGGVSPRARSCGSPSASAAGCAPPDWIPITLGGSGAAAPRPQRRQRASVAVLSREDFPGDHWNIGPHGTFHL